MRWFISPLVSSLSAIVMIYALWEFMGIPSIGAIFSEPRALISFYASIIVPLSIFSYMSTHHLDVRYKEVSEDLKRLRNLIDAYQVILDNINKEIGDLRTSIETQHIPGINKNISSLEKRVSASEKLLSTIIELISSSK